MSTDWDLSRPHETLRAVCIRYLDGRLPSVRFVVIDDSADPGGSELLYREIDDDEPPELRNGPNVAAREAGQARDRPIGDTGPYRRLGGEQALRRQAQRRQSRTPTQAGE